MRPKPRPRGFLSEQGTPRSRAMGSRNTPPLGRPCLPPGLAQDNEELDIRGSAGQSQIPRPALGEPSSSSPNLSPGVTPGLEDQVTLQ